MHVAALHFVKLFHKTIILQLLLVIDSLSNMDA